MTPVAPPGYTIQITLIVPFSTPYMFTKIPFNLMFGDFKFRKNSKLFIYIC